MKGSTMLYYCPLEAYKERYTMQWSAPQTGWLERNWIKANIPYIRIDEVKTLEEPKPITTGCVLDAVGRSQHCFQQINQLLQLAEEKKITNDDCIYFDDFWHPGIEALPYAFSLLGIKPKMYAFLHAQSVDEFDFTYPMRSWMRYFEKGIGKVLDGIFVCGPCLKDLVVFGGIAPSEKVYVTGHPFCSEEVRERMPTQKVEQREPHIIFSSRWDSEKNPHFFLDVAHAVIKQRPRAKFIVCTSAKTIRSNDPANIQHLKNSTLKYPGNIILKENLTKEQYYAELWKAKIQMNTADQDFVAITLLESSVAGCYPIYPYFRSFPETLRQDSKYMYERLDLNQAAKKVVEILDRDDLWSEEQIQQRSWIHTRFDTAWTRMINVMEGKSIDDPYAY